MAKTEWKKISENPPRSGRILIFTPDCDDETMRYRIIDARDLRIMSEATHYIQLSPPSPDIS